MHAVGSSLPRTTGAAAIQARGLSKTFGDVLAVDQVDLSIERGEVFGFLGPNGSGKTTTIRMICGLLQPSAGTALVLGLEIPREAEALRRRLGYMTQRFSLFDDLTVHENLDFLGQIQGIDRSARRRRIESLLDAYALASMSRRLAATLSGGQKQRLALAAAVLHEPELLVLDEPTSAVDPESRRRFWDILFDLSAGGTTILVSTHYMDEAERCHRLAILDRGRLAASGSPRELLELAGSSVVEVDTADPRRVRAGLAGQAGIQGVTQLGVRLRVLVEPKVPDPVAFVGALAEETQRGDAPTVGRRDIVLAATPNLEDVFVAVTRRSDD